jgi:hypothetical protein
VEKAAQLAASSPNHKVKWLLLFNSSDAAVWNTDSPDEKSFAIPLARVPDSIKYLKMQLDPKRVVIIPMAKDKIATLSSNGKFGWEGTNHVVWGGRQLGIFDKTIIIGHEGYKGGPCISWDNGGFSGFGFGYNPGVNNQGYGWDGKAIDQTVFEIYVTSESLSSSERLSLLK